MVLHVRGRTLPEQTPVEFWIADGVLHTEPVAGAETVFDGGWILPGLVDAHCHIGIAYGGGAADAAELVRQAETERAAGVLLVRDAGVPVDTRHLDGRDDLPRILRAGRHLARTKRYLPGLGLDVDDESRLPAVVAEQARHGDGWVKLVGDWIDRTVGDLAPLWSDAALTAAIDAAHAEGARVTAHVFGEDALPGLINAGIDCIEHGTGLTDDLIDLMVARGTALVPTLINIDNFPGIADSAVRYPDYAAHMRALHRSCRPRIAAAREAGVPIYAGTDAGGMVRHGRIADEVAALGGVGMSPTEALGAACWGARRWLGQPGLEPGAPADLVCYSEDPRADAAVLRRPDRVILRGTLR
ncbi:amidohydrolase family protein [Mycolicibacillus parakoreensis]|uniref:Amidohydrolase family protein n=1 Tax=Mycolicibacillus parakoreensis TaxID=1069221 RepID=A0ABY3TWY0_9MYCO|nr:amidohydrolase family protein [Mycolicibacillus parakoreensis]MCV7315860.1 amidohydrolase family protein [Mycolicibacillus parakoreensis]ULN51722.1 amidohydrolase family protein [Mycolicibacillus parakoreensis]